MSTDPATTAPTVSTPMARRACDGLTLGQAVVIARYSNVPWVAAAAQEGPEGFTLGDAYSFPSPGAAGLWWARLLHFADSDGRRCTLSLIPAIDGMSWRMVRKNPPILDNPEPIRPYTYNKAPVELDHADMLID